MGMDKMARYSELYCGTEELPVPATSRSVQFTAVRRQACSSGFLSWNICHFCVPLVHFISCRIRIQPLFLPSSIAYDHVPGIRLIFENLRPGNLSTLAWIWIPYTALLHVVKKDYELGQKTRLRPRELY